MQKYDPRLHKYTGNDNKGSETLAEDSHINVQILIQAANQLMSNMNQEKKYSNTLQQKSSEEGLKPDVI